MAAVAEAIPGSLMIHRSPTDLVVATFALLATIVAACNGGNPGPALTDPSAIVMAALTSTRAAKSVHLEVSVDGTASVPVPVPGASAAPIDMTGTSATVDIDFARNAAKGIVAVPAVLNFSGQAIVVDGKSYIKSSLGGPLYQASAATGSPLDPARFSSVIDNLGDMLLKDPTRLVKGADVACGSKQCYSVSATLTPTDLGPAGAAVTAGLPVDLTGATLDLTIRVEKDLPYHLAGITAVLTMPGSGSKLTLDLTASKWDEPLTITAPPADQIKPTS
jgi:LppX_LprAFG lipoprotein